MKRLLFLILCLVNVAANTSPGAGFGTSPTTAMRFSQAPGQSLITAELKNQMFKYASCVQAATVSNYSVCQMWNPVGSGVNDVILLTRCVIPSGTLSAQWDLTLSPRTILLGTAVSATLGSGVVSHTLFYKDAIASLNTSLQTKNITTNYISMVPIAGAIAVGPGKGIEVAVATQNIQLTCEWLFYEIPQ